MLRGAMVPAEAYKWLEEEFNRRQDDGEPCDGIVAAMLGLLKTTGYVVHMQPSAEPPPRATAEIIPLRRPGEAA